MDQCRFSPLSLAFEPESEHTVMSVQKRKTAWIESLAIVLDSISLPKRQGNTGFMTIPICLNQFSTAWTSSEREKRRLDFVYMVAEVAFVTFRTPKTRFEYFFFYH